MLCTATEPFLPMPFQNPIPLPNKPTEFYHTQLSQNTSLYVERGRAVGPWHQHPAGTVVSLENKACFQNFAQYRLLLVGK